MGLATLGWILLSFTGVALSVLLGYLLGRKGSVQPTLPRGSFMCVNFEPLKGGLPPKVMALRKVSERKGGFYAQSAMDAIEQGQTITQELTGFAGMRKEWHVWNERDLIVINTFKQPWGMYKASVLYKHVQASNELLQHDLDSTRTALADLRIEFTAFQRAFDARVQDEVEKRIKENVKLAEAGKPNKSVARR